MNQAIENAISVLEMMGRFDVADPLRAALQPHAVATAPAWEMPPRILNITRRDESMAPQWAANRYWAAYDYAKRNIKLEELGQELQQAALFLASKGVLVISGEGEKRTVSVAPAPAKCADCPKGGTCV